MVFVNPRLPEYEKKGPDELAGHIWIATSGSSGKIKWVALSNEAILASAHAVNSILQSDSSDVWLNPLPTFHVGGLGILARASLSGASVIPFTGKWDMTGITLTSLVPTQLYDLVTMNFQPPASLRAVIIGGGALDPLLYNQAIALGWPILPSYGLTECASQVATARHGSPTLHLLPHIKAKIVEGRLALSSPSLLTRYADHDPKQEGWFLTEDRAEIKGDKLTLLGRATDCIKISGENVDLTKLDALLERLRQKHAPTLDLALVPLPDPRLGMQLHLATTEPLPPPLIPDYHASVAPFERIHQIHLVSAIPRTPLQKLLRAELTLDLLNKRK